MGPLTNNSIQSTSGSLFLSYYGILKKGEGPIEQERETIPPPDSQASAGLSQWQNGQFLCLWLFLSPAVTLRRVAIVSASSAGGQELLPHLLALPLTRPHCPAQGGELGESRRPGSKQSWSHLHQSEIVRRLPGWSTAK